jgi:hypothetical protein
MSLDEVKHLYTEPLEAEMETLMAHIEKQVQVSDSNDVNDIDNILQRIVQTIHTCSARLKRTRYSKGLKPYWNNILNAQFKTKNNVWKKWRYAGSKKNGTLYDDYKQAKWQFRQELY